MGETASEEGLGKDSVSVRLCEWSDRNLLVVVQNRTVDSALARQADARLEVYSEDAMIADFSCYFENALGGLWACTIDCAALTNALDENIVTSIDCAALTNALDENIVTSLTMKLALTRNGQTLRSESLNRRNQHSSAFTEFMSGFFLDDIAILIPDESKSNDYTLRAVGWKADASNQEYARSKKDRKFTNKILLESLSKGPGIAHAVASSFTDPETEPILSISKNGEAWAVFDKFDHELKFNLAHTRGLTNVNLLDDDKPLSRCVARHWIPYEIDVLMKPIIEFDKLCKMHDVEYMAGFGTLLGAVRHKDIIPWDHDVDLFMTQDNYMKLRRLFDSGKMPEHLRLDDWMSVEGYPGPLGRFNDISAVKLNTRNAYGHADIGSFGIAFDIFPLIGVSGTRDDAERIRAKAIAFWEIENRVARSKLIRTIAVIEEYAKLEERYAKEGRESVRDELRAEIYSTPDADADFYIVGVSGQRNSFIFEKNWVEPLVELPFGNMNMPCPRDYFKVLRELYGPNFRKFPGGKAQTPKRYGHLRSFELSYETVRQTYLQDADLAEELKNRSDLKDLRMREAIERCYETRSVCEIRTALLEEKMAKLFEGLDLSKRGEGDYTAIDAACAPFLSLQTKDKPHSWRIPLKIDQERLAIVLEDLLCYRGEAGDAAQILSIRFDNTDNPNEQIGNKLKKISDAVRNTIEMRDCYEYGKIDEAAAHAEQVLAAYPFAIEARCMKIVIELDESPDANWLEAAREELEYEAMRSLSLLPLVLLVAIACKTGDALRAKPLCRMIERDCNDGMTLNYLRSIMEEACLHGN